MDTRYFLGVLKKSIHWIFEILSLCPFFGHFWVKMGIFWKFWPKNGQKRGKISKFRKFNVYFFWGPLRSTLCPKISLFGQFGLELLHFSWFSGNCDFVTEMLISARIWREKPDFFQNRYFLQLFFAEVCKTNRYSYKKHHLIHLNHCFLEKRPKMGQK